MSTPSTLIADRYRLVKMLGAGGMGVVWQAWDERLHRPVALKMLRSQPELTETERQLSTDRAMREARIAAGLHHPHAVTVFDVVEHEGQPCIVMQLIESTPLSALLKEHGTMSPPAAARVGAEISSALAVAHRMRIVHRDVKPGNILITADGSAMISDFGISHALGDTTITATGVIHGTPAYLAPEVARGLPTTFASDVFSLGSTLYAMLEGVPPFGSDNNAIALLHRVARGGYPPPAHAGPLAPLLEEMLETNPKRRPNMASIADALSTAGQGALAPVSLPSATESADGTREEDVPAPVTEDPRTSATLPAAAIATAAFSPEPPTPLTVPAVTRPLAEPDATTGRTLPADQPTRYEPPTAETEPLGRAAAGAGAAGAREPSTVVVQPNDAPAGEPPAQRRRRAWVLTAILVLVALFVGGAAMLYSALRPDESTAEPTASRSPAPAAANTPSPEESLPTPSPSVPTAEAAPPPTPRPTSPATPEQRVVEAISSYYAMLPGDLDAAWPLMTADYQQNHAGGRGEYESFWSDVAAVEITDVVASAPDRAQATLTYQFRDGRLVQEVTGFRLVDEGGVLKIAATEVLSSSQL